MAIRAFDTYKLSPLISDDTWMQFQFRSLFLIIHISFYVFVRNSQNPKKDAIETFGQC